MEPSEWEINQGTVTYEVDLSLAANSGREKHVDLGEQGAWLALAFDKGLRSVETPGLMVTEIRTLVDGEVVSTHPVKGGVEPFAEDKYFHLLDLVRELSYLAAELLQKAPHDEGDHVQFDHPDATELLEIIRHTFEHWQHVPDSAPLDENLVRGEWRRALEP